MLNDVSGQLERQHDADGGQRHREHDDERIAQRLVLRRHHGVDEHERQDQHQPQLVERLGLLLDLGAEADARSPGGTLNLAAAAPGRPSTASLSVRFGLGVDAGDALLVLALDLRSGRSASSTVIRFFAWQHLAAAAC